MTTTLIKDNHSAPRVQNISWAQIALLVALSVGFESLFIHHGIAWLFDEGWPLYAAKQLHEGGVLYRDIFFSFPPGHLLPAWIAYALDPPGITLARIFYAGFNVCLVVATYLLGCRLMPRTFATLGAAMLALAAPRAHLAHLLFGYRFLVFSVLALILFSLYLQRGDRRLMFLAGLATGVALYFRLTPAFAVSCGIGVAVMAASRDRRDWLRDWSLYGAGLLVVVVPLMAWLAASVGLDVVWREWVVRIIELQELQSKEIPPFIWVFSTNRHLIFSNFVSVQYWGFGAMYLGYLIVLAVSWRRNLASNREFPHVLLLAVAIWGGVYLLRTLGRSDEHHLASALPPACRLLAHSVATAFRSRVTATRSTGVRSIALCCIVLVAWVMAQGSDLYLEAEMRGTHPVPQLVDEIAVRTRARAKKLGNRIDSILRHSRPGDTILDLTYSPLLHVVTDRNGPGFIDVITPGVFLNDDEERQLIRLLESRPPALVLLPERDFDRMPSRSLSATAPLVLDWVRAHYAPPASNPGDRIWMPRDAPQGPSTGSTGMRRAS